ncbi:MULTISPECIES: DbpA RNA binding domain-containing protein [unclassified Treponema]|uniref:DbpA RNA binding domain-containing protein n=1 Tax=unclassified Treponema TaxID=2638727 RepID=UPI0005300CAB|nr:MULTISPECIES: DbpA RNA binding domain-containing protein [unclassified Treponema]AIW90489.1 RNA-binding protein [Treponema sp. OMZ 838]UTC43899.1 RNA-binding protein [Treponema sp. OMZ 857]UTC51685.1 DbpA RNA binding domain-containing protein [Treponema sp. OMZ 855]
MVKQTPALNEEQITAFLKEVVETVKTEEDPDVLNAYRKIFRKNVPFTLRSYIAAYLIKEFEGSSFPRSKPYSRRPNPRFGDRSRGYVSDRPPVERPMLDPSESVSIFMSIGRSRRVFPRDIITLLIQNADISRERIGDIRILDNYSFVQVMNEDADKIIEKLNDFPYRGKNISVSYSRKPEAEEIITETVIETTGSDAE